MKIIRPKIIETTALGAALTAAIYTNFWSIQEFTFSRKIDKIFYTLNLNKSNCKLLNYNK
jgi:glycerol kinase